MKLTSTLAVLLGSFATSYAYILDSSCSPYSDMVISGLAGAFDLAQAGSDTMSTLATGSGSGDTWQAQQDLVSYTFAEALTNGNIDTSNPKWITASDKFTSVLKYNSNNGQPDTNNYNNQYKSLPTDALVIFCDFTRFAENQNCKGVAKPGIVCDRAMRIAFPMNDAYYHCRDDVASTPSLAQAGVWEWASQGFPRASEMQLCPGYIAKMQQVKIQTLEEEGDKPSLARDWAKFTTWVGDGVSLPMDVAATWDLALLHELTHAVPNAATKDVAGQTASYRWANVIRLSGNGGTNNAENYAFFGLGSRMISPKENGPQAQRPMKDGSIQALGETSKRKRDLDLHPRARGHLQPWRRDPNITLTLDNTTVILNASNTAGFVFTESGSTKPVTISTGMEYTIGTDVIELESAGVVYDHSTLSFPPAVSASASATTSSASSSASASATTSSASSSASASATTISASSSASASASATTSSASTSGKSPSRRDTSYFGYLGSSLLSRYVLRVDYS
jgi:hypothetical protein